MKITYSGQTLAQSGIDELMQGDTPWAPNPALLKQITDLFRGGSTRKVHERAFHILKLTEAALKASKSAQEKISSGDPLYPHYLVLKYFRTEEKSLHARNVSNEPSLRVSVDEKKQYWHYEMNIDSDTRIQGDNLPIGDGRVFTDFLDCERWMQIDRHLSSVEIAGGAKPLREASEPDLSQIRERKGRTGDAARILLEIFTIALKTVEIYGHGDEKTWNRICPSLILVGIHSRHHGHPGHDTSERGSSHPASFFPHLRRPGRAETSGIEPPIGLAAEFRLGEHTIQTIPLANRPALARALHVGLVTKAEGLVMKATASLRHPTEATGKSSAEKMAPILHAELGSAATLLAGRGGRALGFDSDTMEGRRAILSFFNEQIVMYSELSVNDIDYGNALQRYHQNGEPFLDISLPPSLEDEATDPDEAQFIHPGVGNTNGGETYIVIPPDAGRGLPEPDDAFTWIPYGRT